ncbi:MAG: acyl-CoA dehydrogenase family protein, partial [Porticoccaceae bacterium]
MSDFKVPVNDYLFLFNDVMDMQQNYQHVKGGDQATPDMIEAIFTEGAKFCENELSPLYQSGDDGCQWNQGEVTTPSGFKEAYQKYVEAGWPSLTGTPDLGGQGLPPSVSSAFNEMLNTANWAWAMYPGLSEGAVATLEDHGTEEQKNIYLSKLISGVWSGTMCLTEAHCGTDLGQMKTKAVPNDDGSYNINGTKIFISAGEHDLTENIVHIVLAKLPDAPEGTKGISLFIIPKFLPAADGSVGDRNGVHCGSIEHKMGIHGNATAVLNFDDAKGFLIGAPHSGLSAMFTYMNVARIGTASQGTAAAERSYQGAAAYAIERLAMRSISGVKNPDGPADPIVCHPDVRRMALNVRAFNEASRAFASYVGMQLDISKFHEDEQTRKH